MQSFVRAALAAVVVVSAAPAALADSSPNIAGVWQTTYGPLEFTVTDIKDANGA